MTEKKDTQDEGICCEICSKEVDYRGENGIPMLVLEVEDDLVVVCKSCLCECVKVARKMSALMGVLHKKTKEMEEEVTCVMEKLGANGKGKGGSG